MSRPLCVLPLSFYWWLFCVLADHQIAQLVCILLFTGSIWLKGNSLPKKRQEKQLRSKTCRNKGHHESGSNRLFTLDAPMNEQTQEHRNSLSPEAADTSNAHSLVKHMVHYVLCPYCCPVWFPPLRSPQGSGLLHRLPPLLNQTLGGHYRPDIC